LILVLSETWPQPLAYIYTLSTFSTSQHPLCNSKTPDCTGFRSLPVTHPPPLRRRTGSKSGPCECLLVCTHSTYVTCATQPHPQIVLAKFLSTPPPPPPHAYPPVSTKFEPIAPCMYTSWHLQLPSSRCLLAQQLFLELVELFLELVELFLELVELFLKLVKLIFQLIILLLQLHCWWQSRSPEAHGLLGCR
jgi:hypothetical protein